MPSWKKVQEGRPKPAKPASQASLGATAHLTKFKKAPSVSSLGLERNLPFVVGHVRICNCYNYLDVNLSCSWGGQNTGKSYSVTANLQTVHSLLKSHNPTLCTICSTKDCAQECERPDLMKAAVPPKPRAVSAPVKKNVSKKKASHPSPKASPLKTKPVLILGKSNSVLREKLKELEAEFRALKQYPYVF